MQLTSTRNLGRGGTSALLIGALATSSPNPANNCRDVGRAKKGTLISTKWIFCACLCRKVSDPYLASIQGIGLPRGARSRTTWGRWFRTVR